MKRNMIAIAALIASTGAAGAAAADDQGVALQGAAPVDCRLPASWSYVSGFNGPTAGSFDGTTFTIPESALVDANSTPVAGGEYAIRVRGQGFCNTSHTISIQSVRGGLTVGAPSSTPPAGFSNRRPLNYQAGWRNDAGVGSAQGNPMGPLVQMTADVPGESATGDYIVSGALAPPGNRNFDVRIGMSRPAGQPPLIAGDYHDRLVVTLTTF